MKVSATAPAAFCAACTTAIMLGISYAVVVTHPEWIPSTRWREAIIPQLPSFLIGLSALVLGGWASGGRIAGRAIRIPLHQTCVAASAFAAISAGVVSVAVTLSFPLTPLTAFLTLPISLMIWAFIGSLGVSFALSRRAGVPSGKGTVGTLSSR